MQQIHLKNHQQPTLLASAVAPNSSSKRASPAPARRIPSLKPSLGNKKAPSQFTSTVATLASLSSSLSTFKSFLGSTTSIDQTLQSLDEATLPTGTTKGGAISTKTTTTPTTTTLSYSSQPPILSCAGGGIFFFWELGVIKYLEENYNLDQVQLVGCSAGALVGVLLACGVQPDRAMKEAFRLSEENDVWTRPGGVAGIWGSLIKQWLDELLPGNAAERCNGRVKVIATRVPGLNLKYLDVFETKQDVIDACMASVHIPFFLDGNATYSLNGVQYIDGSLWDFLSGDNSALIKCEGAACVIDYFMDDQLQYSRLDFIKLAQYDEVKSLMQSGYAWAERTDAVGGFDATLASVKKWTVRKVLEYPVLQLARALA